VAKDKIDHVAVDQQVIIDRMKEDSLCRTLLCFPHHKHGVTGGTPFSRVFWRGGALSMVDHGQAPLINVLIDWSQPN
jgi:hypothetical protein